MDYAALQFAATVRNTAASIHGNARQQAVVKILNEYSNDSQDAKIAEWDLMNPFAKYVPIALAEIETVAHFIRK